MDTQIKMGFDCEQAISIDEEDIKEENNERGALVYKVRLERLVKEIAEVEDMVGVQFSEEGTNRIQKASELLIGTLVFEILEDLKNKNKRRILLENVDNALDKILHSSSAIDIAVDLLRKDIETLKSINTSKATSKATQFVNNQGRIM